MKSKEKAKERGGVAIAGIHVVVGVSECAMCKLKEKSHPTIKVGWDFSYQGRYYWKLVCMMGP